MCTILICLEPNGFSGFIVTVWLYPKDSDRVPNIYKNLDFLISSVELKMFINMYLQYLNKVE